MLIQIFTDTNLKSRESLANHVESLLEDALGRFSERIARLDVHLRDLNADKMGPDELRCLLEARLEGRQPTAVSHQGLTVDQAVAGAVEKLKRSFDSAKA